MVAFERRNLSEVDPSRQNREHTDCVFEAAARRYARGPVTERLALFSLKSAVWCSLILGAAAIWLVGVWIFLTVIS